MQSPSPYITLTGTLVPGHRVASGQSAHSPYPRGTIEMQQPHFLSLGVDLSPFYPGTLNVSIAPHSFELVPPTTLHYVKWSPHHEAESFSFVPVTLTWLQQPASYCVYEGLIYYPRPETKIDHFQDPAVIELLMPWIEGIGYGSGVTLTALANELIIKS